MPNATLSSVDQETVAAGENRLLMQNADGWEVIGWQQADLIGPEEWRLSGLLRGQAGSPLRTAKTGALVILLTADLVSIPIASEEVGIELNWRAGESELQAFTFRDRASLPWRVGHLKAEPRSGGVHVSWTDRGPEFKNNWMVEDPVAASQFDVRTVRSGIETQHPAQSETHFSVAAGSADQIRVAKIGADQRRGEWVSIPLSSP